MISSNSFQNLYGWFDDVLESPRSPTHHFWSVPPTSAGVSDSCACENNTLSARDLDIQMEEEQCHSQTVMKSFANSNGTCFSVQVSIPKFRVVQLGPKSISNGFVSKYLLPWGCFFSSVDRHAEYLVVMQLGDRRVTTWKRSTEFAQLVSTKHAFLFVFSNNFAG